MARTALITGGAKRVGAAIARHLASNGFTVAITYNTSQKDADQLAAEIRGIAIQADLTHPESDVAKVCKHFGESFGQLDLLVNNASAYTPATLKRTTVELSRRLMAIHVEAPMLLCQGLAPLLRLARGHVVNMVDAMVDRPMPNYLAYSASKAALWNLTLGLARELAPEVTVNGIAPGVVEWPDDLPAKDRETYLKRVPLKRAGSPADVARLVHFLATDGSYISGQIIRLDGGRSVSQ